MRASALKNMRTKVLTTKQMIADPAKLLWWTTSTPSSQLCRVCSRLFSALKRLLRTIPTRQSCLGRLLVLHQGNFEEFIVRASALKNMRTKVLTTKQMIADPAKLLWWTTSNEKTLPVSSSPPPSPHQSVSSSPPL